jgi:tetratricopeptide (TPR) repeat protein
LLYSRLGEVAKAESEWQAAIKLLPREPMIWLARARQLVERKRPKEAETALAKIAEFKSDDPVVWKEGGRLRFELGQTDKAAADFRKAVELFGDKARANEPAASEADKLFARLADDAILKKLTAAVERNPEDTARRWKRGEWYARHARWKEAAGDFTIVLERNPPTDALQWLYAAPALAMGDRESYRRQGREMLKRFAATQDPPTADRAAKAYLLLPEVSKETELACQLADRANTLGKKHLYALCFIFGKGLADYRRGNLRSAIESLDSLLLQSALGSDFIAQSHLIMAMALHRKGEAKAARDHLAQGANLLKQHIPDPNRFSALSSNDSGYSHDWVITWLLHDEAKALIEGKKAEPSKK